MEQLAFHGILFRPSDAALQDGVRQLHTEKTSICSSKLSLPTGGRITMQTGDPPTAAAAAADAAGLLRNSKRSPASTDMHQHKPLVSRKAEGPQARNHPSCSSSQAQLFQMPHPERP